LSKTWRAMRRTEAFSPKGQLTRTRTRLFFLGFLLALVETRRVRARLL
jgi:hypothetical protein